ncbi:MAG: hypothetical protein HQL37_06515 [Alphaproteobacteria bacterium]|nr:hypothetical protein [Alphaproteobacteria bacterium]
MALNFLKNTKNLSLGRLFRLGRKGAEAAPPAEEEANKWYDGTETPLLAIEGLLKDEAQRRNSKVHIIAVEDFRIALGDKWLRLRGKVALIADGIIQRHIGPGNLSNTIGDDKFILVFRTVPVEEGRRRTILIANELGRRLVGANFTGMETAKVRIAEVAPEELLTESGALDLENLSRLAAAGEAIEPIELPAAPIPGAPPASTPGGIASMTNPERKASAKGRPGWTDIDHPSTPASTDLAFTPSTERTGPAPTWQAIEGVGLDTRGDGPQMVEIEGQPRKAPLGDWVAITPETSHTEPRDYAAPAAPASRRVIDILYRPTWNAQTQAVDIHCCLPILREGQTVLDSTKALAAIGGATERFDQMVVAAAMAGLTNMAAKRTKSTLVVPIHFATLHKRTFSSILDVLGGCADAIRLLHLVFEIIDIPEITSAERLAQGAATLNGLCREVILRSPLAWPRFNILGAAHPAAIGVDLDTTPAQERSESKFAATLAEFRAGAGTTPVYLWGVRRRPEVLAAVEVGFAMINGTVLMADQPEPRKTISVPLATFKKAATAKTK